MGKKYLGTGHKHVRGAFRIAVGTARKALGSADTRKTRRRAFRSDRAWESNIFRAEEARRKAGRTGGSGNGFRKYRFEVGARTDLSRYRYSACARGALRRLSVGIVLRSGDSENVGDADCAQTQADEKKIGLIATCASLLLIVITTVVLATCLPAPECRHVYIEETTDATCSSVGYVTEVCTKCGYKRKSSQIAKLKHTVGEWVVDKEATCTGLGRKHSECTVCHTTTETVTIDKLAHSYTDKLISPEGGPSYYLCTCEKCGDSYKANADLEFEFIHGIQECHVNGIKDKTVAEIVIPASANGYKVTRIKYNAFKLQIQLA